MNGLGERLRRRRGSRWQRQADRQSDCPSALRSPDFVEDQYECGGFNHRTRGFVDSFGRNFSQRLRFRLSQGPAVRRKGEVTQFPEIDVRGIYFADDVERGVVNSLERK